MNADQIAHNAEFFERPGMVDGVDSVPEALTEVYGEEFMTHDRQAAFDGIISAIQQWEQVTSARFSADEVSEMLSPLLKNYDHPCTPEWRDDLVSP